jgi:hypothetical protein
VGFTVIDPVADVEVKVPGVMAIDAAPVTFQLSELLEPSEMVAGLALNDVISGAFTVTMILDVTEPAEFVAVRE